MKKDIFVDFKRLVTEKDITLSVEAEKCFNALVERWNDYTKSISMPPMGREDIAAFLAIVESCRVSADMDITTFLMEAGKFYLLSARAQQQEVCRHE